MAKKGKKYLAVASLIEEDKFYTVDEAIELLKKTTVTKFDSSCEVHFKLGLDPKQAEQNLRTTVSLPNGTGKDVTVVAFVDASNAEVAKKAGASEAGTEELVAKIEKGWLDFDIAVATPDQMKSLGKIAKTLGQKGLMPNPKSGTVTPEFEKIIRELKKGKIEIRVDKQANTHNIFGKVSFENDKLKANLLAILKTINDNKPSSSKGVYLQKMVVATSMGPGIAIDIASAKEESK